MANLPLRRSENHSQTVCNKLTPTNLKLLLQQKVVLPSTKLIRMQAAFFSFGLLTFFFQFEKSIEVCNNNNKNFLEQSVQVSSVIQVNLVYKRVEYFCRNYLNSFLGLFACILTPLTSHDFVCQMAFLSQKNLLVKHLPGKHDF